MSNGIFVNKEVLLTLGTRKHELLTLYYPVGIPTENVYPEKLALAGLF